jgi:hypothetical protein
MFILRFVRKDSQPNEEYCYFNYSDAENHLKLFIDDDSDLYDHIELFDSENEQAILSNIQF